MIYRAGMVGTLARREVQQTGERPARERGRLFHTPTDGERIKGTYRGAVQLISGKYALVETSREFTLVPWRPLIEKELGRAVFGVFQDGSISWALRPQARAWYPERRCAMLDSIGAWWQACQAA